MKKKFTLTLVLLVFISGVTFGQKKKDNTKKTDGYKFTEKIIIPVTDVKNQYRSGTCWSFSTLSFLEAEMIRMGKKHTDLSEMFVVNQC